MISSDNDSKVSKFSAKCCFCADFGIGIIPRCLWNWRRSFTGVVPSFFASDKSSGSLRSGTSSACTLVSPIGWKAKICFTNYSPFEIYPWALFRFLCKNHSVDHYWNRHDFRLDLLLAWLFPLALIISIVHFLRLDQLYYNYQTLKFNSHSDGWSLWRLLAVNFRVFCYYPQRHFYAIYSNRNSQRPFSSVW